MAEIRTPLGIYKLPVWITDKLPTSTRAENIAINSAFCCLGSPAPRIVEKAAEARANNKERNKMKKEIEREAKLGKSRTYQLITQQENPED